MQNSLHFTREMHRNSNAIAFFTAVLTLILIDQITKTLAFNLAPAAPTVIDQPGWFMGIAWHIHEPNEFSTFSALGAFALVAFTCMLPIASSVKVLWTAAAFSNHVEMLSRPGTVDFLAFKLGNRAMVANVADIYFAIGIVVLMVTLAKQIRSAKSWLEPVTA